MGYSYTAVLFAWPLYINPKTFSNVLSMFSDYGSEEVWQMVPNGDR